MPIRTPRWAATSRAPGAYLAPGHRLLVRQPPARFNFPVAHRTHPDLVYRLLGYGGLALLAILQLCTAPDAAAAGLLAYALCWPPLWWSAVCRQPALRSPMHRLSPLTHVVECLVVLALVALLGVEQWFLLSVALLCLTGVTALGGLRLLAPCAGAVGVVLLGYRFWSVPEPIPGAVTLLGWLLLASCLLGLAWQSYGQVRRLDARRQHAISESARLRDSNHRLARYLPQGLMPMISEAPETLRPPRERFVTVAFLDVVGFAELVAAHGTAEVADVLNDFMATVSRITDHHGGVVGKFLGDGVLVYFSEPEPPFDPTGARTPDSPAADRARAAAAAARMTLDLGPAMEDLGRAWCARGLIMQLKARAGIASGYCALGDWGGAARLDYTLIGTPVNLASRLQEAALPGATLLSGAAAALIAQDEYLGRRLTGPRAVVLKGFGEVMVHDLTASAKVRAIPMPVQTGKPDS